MNVLAFSLAVIVIVATVVANVPRLSRLVRDKDPLAMVPAWSFFAPHPGVSDPILIIRDYLPDGTVTPWRVAWRETYVPNRWVWRPHKRVSKLVGDCASILATTTANPPLTAAFLLLGRLAETAPHDALSEFYEFGIVNAGASWSASLRTELAFVSGRLRLPVDTSSAQAACLVASDRD